MSSSSPYFTYPAVPSSPSLVPSHCASPTGHLPVRDLVTDSESDAAAAQSPSNTQALQALVQAFVDPRNANFTTDSEGGITRYVKVEFHGRQSLRLRNIEALDKSTQGTPWQASVSRDIVDNVAIFEFDSFTDAQAAVDAEDQLGLGPVSINFIPIEEFAELCDGVHKTRLFFNRYEGQLMVKIVAPSTSDVTLEEACLAITSWIDERLGTIQLLSVLLVNVVRDYNSHEFHFRVELDSCHRAETEVSLQRFDGRIKVRGQIAKVKIASSSKYSIPVEPYAQLGYQPILARPNSPLGFSLLSGGAVQPTCSSRRNSGPRRSSFGSGRRDDQSNTIDLEKIKRGQDVRTTVMLRNIPNQMTTYDLERLLKGWAFGQFDFLYLRIDFANMCNVGYAFVNFDSPMTIVKVKQQLDAEGWPGHLGSNKRAAMSYATVQGVESLIEKFRNSSVMLEAPQCRPRLFWTLHDVCADPLQWHLQSQEKPFPGPNNEAKLARSRQNAETQGLYPAHSREEHRRGYFHSNFDRGNPNSFFGHLAYF